MSNVKNITFDAMEDEQTLQPQKTSAYDAKNYLNVKLESTETHKEIKVRLLPVDKDSNSPFQVYHTHNLAVDKKIAPSGWKRYICLEKNEDVDQDKFGAKCPCCELNRFEYAEAQKSTSEIEKRIHTKNSLAYKSDQACAIRCIERGHEEDGPKFWQFAIRSDGKDPMNVIKALFKTRRDESINDALEEYGVKTVDELPEDFTPDNILDIYTGKDLQINIDAVFDKQGNRTTKTSITIIDCGKPKPLSRDEAQIEAWVNDEKRVYDVFTPKPYEYLKLLCQGKIPYFNKKTNKWEEWKDKKEIDSEKAYKEEEANEDIRQAEEEAKKVALEQATKKTVVVNNDDDDIPF